MGYELEETIYTLRFEGKRAGLVVSAYEPPLGFLEKAMQMAPLAGRRADEMTPEELGLVSDFFGSFSEHLIEWNLEKRGEPVPATEAGLKSLGLGFVMEIVEAWLEGVQGVDAPLAPPSSSGRPSLVASLPMEPLSASPESSSGPSSSSEPASDSGASLVS